MGSKIINFACFTKFHLVSNWGLSFEVLLAEIFFCVAVSEKLHHSLQPVSEKVTFQKDLRRGA